MELCADAEIECGTSVNLLGTDGEHLAWAEDEYVCLNLLRIGTAAGPCSPRTLARERPMRLSSRGWRQAPLTALCLGSGALGSSDPRPQERNGEPLVIGANKHAVVAWRVRSLSAAMSRGDALGDGLTILTGVGQVDALALSSSRPHGGMGMLAVCAGSCVHIVQLATLKHELRLEGHAAPVLCAAFCEPHAPHWLATCGEDRCLMVWDLREGSLIYQSPILTASALTSLAVDPSYLRVAVGAADGVVRFFDLAAAPSCRCLQVLDLGKQLQKAADQAAALGAAAAAAAAVSGPRVVRAQPAWKQQLQEQEERLQQVTLEDGADEDECCTSAAALGLYYSPLRTATPDGDTGLLAEAPRLLAGSVRALAVIDSHAYSLLQSHFFRGGAPPSAAFSPSPAPPAAAAAAGSGTVHMLAGIATARAFAFGLDPSGACVQCCAASPEGILVLTLVPQALPGVAALAVQEHRQRYGPGLSEGPPGGEAGSSDQLPAEGREGMGGGEAGGPLPAIAEEGGRRQWEVAGGEGRAEGGAGSRGVGQQGQRGGAGRAPATERVGVGGAGRGGGGGFVDKEGWEAGPPLLSVFHTRALPEGSPLRPSPAGSRAASPGLTRSNSGSGSSSSKGGGRSSDSAAPSKPPAGRVHSASPQRSRPAASKAQPVTFHRQIKSSGYGFVQPQVRLGKPPPAPIKLAPHPAPSSNVARHLLQARSYPVQCDPPLVSQEHNCLPNQQAVHHGAIVRLKYSGDASRLLTTSTDKTARVMRLPLSSHSGGGTDLIGHNAGVGAGDWSLDGSLVLTASADRSARLWNAGCATPLMHLSHASHTAPTAQPGGQDSGPPTPTKPPLTQQRPSVSQQGAGNQPFLHEVTAARFYYQDRFILLSCGNKLNLYRYKLAEGDPGDDIARLRATAKYKKAASHTSAAQTINDFAAVNSFLSPIALLAGSNRSVEAVDCTTMQTVATMHDAHARPVHTIVQSASASLYTSHAREASELFATAACDGALRLWDLRVSRCVRTLSGHQNTQLTVGAAFSPCLRFMGCGSEDRAAYVYDMRMGSVLARLGRHGAAVTDVAFNPLHPQMAVGTLAGTLHFYTS